MNLLEIKFYKSEYAMQEEDAAAIERKVASFKTATKTKKNVFITLLTAQGAKRNEHFLSVVTNELRLSDLFVE